MNWRSFFIGLLAGWLIERWIDSFYWRRRRTPRRPALGDGAPTQDAAVARSAAEPMPVEPVGSQPVAGTTRSPAIASPLSADDLEVIEGIGPKIAALLKEHGVSTFAQLAGADEASLRHILQLGGPRFRVANPASWPRQAGLAAAGDWEALKALQDTLSRRAP